MLPFSEIDTRRAAAGIQQKALAAAAGMTPQAYAKLRKGSTRGATEKTLKALSDALSALEDLQPSKGEQHGIQP